MAVRHTLLWRQRVLRGQAAVQDRGHDGGGYDFYWPDPQQPYHVDIAFFRRSSRRLVMVMSLLESLYKSLYMLKIPLLVSLGHHGGLRKAASLRPPFSTPLRSLGEPDPETPFLVPIEHAPPLFVRIREDKISLKIYPAPLRAIEAF